MRYFIASDFKARSIERRNEDSKRRSSGRAALCGFVRLGGRTQVFPTGKRLLQFAKRDFFVVSGSAMHAAVDFLQREDCNEGRGLHLKAVLLSSVLARGHA